jgi:glycosyltransferase involved in cell wall biosynthesis
MTPRVVHVISTAGPHPWFTTLIEDGGADRDGLMVGCVGPAGALQDEMLRLGVETFALGAGSRAGFPLAIARLARMLRAHRADVVQTHLVDGCLVGLAAARLARVPVTIMTAHHSHELPFHGRRLRWPDKLCAGPLSNHIIAPSADVAETMVQYLGVRRQKIEVIHHGFDLTRLDPGRVSGEAVRRELGLEGKVVLGSIGRIYWLKNQEALVRAFAAVDPDATLVLAGPGDPWPLRSLAAELGVEERVVFTGPRPDVPELLAALDAFVHPAIAESFGMVIVEAMAMARPVLSTPVGIAGEIVGTDTGVLARSSSIDDIADGLRTLLQARDRWPAMGAAARERAGGFTAKAMAARYEQLYGQFLAGPTRVVGSDSA